MRTNYEVSAKETLYVEELLGKLQKGEIKDLSPKENIIHDLLKSFPAYTREQSEKIADDLINGVTTFTSNLEGLKKEDAGWVKAQIAEAVKKLTPEQKYEFLSNFLLALKAVDAALLSDLLQKEEAGVQQQLEELLDSGLSAGDAEISPEQIDELMSLAAEAMKNSGILLAGNKELLNLVNTMSANESAIDDFVKSNWDDAKIKYYTAYATYKAYLEGKISSLPKDCSAEMIAVGVAAGLERTKVISDAESGKTTWETAMHILQLICFAVGLCLILWVCVNAALLCMVAGMEIAAFLFGGGIVAVVIGMVLGGYVGFKIGTVVAAVLGHAIAIVTDLITEHIAPFVVASVVGTWNFISKKIREGMLRLGGNRPTVASSVHA